MSAGTTTICIATLIACLAVTPAQAGFDEKVAASFSAKYEVCAIRLRDKPGYFFKSIGMGAEAERIHRDKLGGGGYIKALVKEKQKAWLMPLHKCKKLAKKF